MLGKESDSSKLSFSGSFNGVFLGYIIAHNMPPTGVPEKSMQIWVGIALRNS